MVLWFLRLFSEFRSLEALIDMQARETEQFHAQIDAARERADKYQDQALDTQSVCASLREDLANSDRVKAELISEKVLLEERLTIMTAEKDRAWETADRALEGERYALHTMVNHATQKAGGGVPYADAHTLPPSEVRRIQTAGPVGRKGRVLASELAQRETGRFVQEFVESLNPTAIPEKAA